jgi:hypothetical protein
MEITFVGGFGGGRIILNTDYKSQYSIRYDFEIQNSSSNFLFVRSIIQSLKEGLIQNAVHNNCYSALHFYVAIAL